MKNFIGLDKGTNKSRFAITNGSFRNTMMIRLIKVIKKYRILFNEHPNLYNNIINDFGNRHGKIEDNTNINAIIRKIQLTKV